MVNRTKRMQKIINSVRDCKDQGADKEKLLAVMCFEWGCARRTCLEYITTLVNAEQIYEKDKILYSDDNTN